MKINWKVRFLSVKFWLALVPAVLLVVQTVAAVFGYKWDFVILNQQVAAVINSIFAVLTILGVTIDPTTPGIGDSSLVLSRASQVVAPSSAVQVPNPNPQGQQIAETPLIQPISADDTSVSHETAVNGADSNVSQH
ncbi:phage holin [Schleiferilactobacillus harbinensis]|uniref:phage holin n=1 Tax=Schleiferilactobacillus harbinensis TaxID=304207 RepID=UPI0009DBFEEE|nr:phage holin [Schleiferilactobacillus harbinensis]QFR64983.1 phage holin [Schleiferilactobacillus harbinensis]